MAFENLKAGRDSLNVTIPQGKDIMSQIVASGASKGQTVALFANPTGGNTGALMVPLTASQDNGSALWVDPASNLTDLKVPDTERIFLQVWVEAHGTYYMVGGILRSLKYETIAEALS
jgi:hypothetical protein